MATSTGTHEDALKQVLASGIINPEAKLTDLISLTQSLTSTGNGASSTITADNSIACFIHSGFVAIHVEN